MTERPSVVGICGSLRDESYTRIAITHALDAAEGAGAETTLIDLRTWDLPLFDPDDRDRGDATQLKEVVGEAHGIILGTPVYHGMVSSGLKNAFDYLGKDEFSGTVVGLLATAGGGTYGQTLEHLRTGVRTVHGWTLPHEVGIRGASSAIENGEFVDADIQARVETLGRMVAEHAPVNEAGPQRIAADD